MHLFQLIVLINHSAYYFHIIRTQHPIELVATRTICHRPSYLIVDTDFSQ